MKIKKSYIIGAVIVVLLAVFIVMGVTKPDDHAGHDHGTTQSTADDHAGHDHATQPDGPTGADLTPDEAYTLVDNKDGTYNVHVTDRNGNRISTDTFYSKPTFTEVNQDVLEVADRTSANSAAHWAKFYDIQNHRVSQTYSFVLATMDHHVAYVDKRDDTFMVFVRDLFDESEYFKTYALEGAVHTSSGSPQVTYTLDGTTMTVTYTTADGTDTQTIKMFAE